MLPAPFIVVLDADVLFPFSLRDTLLRAAAAGFYQLRWSYPAGFVDLLREQAEDLINPPMTFDELLGQARPGRSRPGHRRS